MFYFVSFLTFSQNESDFYFPIEIQNEKVYVQKFSHIHVKDFEEEDIKKIISGDSSNMSEFLEILDYYNKIYYRKVNDRLQTLINEYKKESQFLPAYFRDFNEDNDTLIRFIVTCDFSIIDVYNQYKTKGYFSFNDSYFKYYIYDRQEKIKYQSFKGIYAALSGLDLLFDYSEKENFIKLERKAREKKILKKINKNLVNNTSQEAKYGLRATLYSAIIVAVNYYINL